MFRLPRPRTMAFFSQFLKLPARILRGICSFPLSRNETKRMVFWSWISGSVGTLLILAVRGGDWKGAFLSALSILFSVYMMTEDLR